MYMNVVNHTPIYLEVLVMKNKHIKRLLNPVVAMLVIAPIYWKILMLDNHNFTLIIIILIKSVATVVIVVSKQRNKAKSPHKKSTHHGGKSPNGAKTKKRKLKRKSRS